LNKPKKIEKLKYMAASLPEPHTLKASLRTGIHKSVFSYQFRWTEIAIKWNLS